MILCRPLDFTPLVLPGGIGINDRIASDSYTPFSPDSTDPRAVWIRSLAAA